MRGPAPALAMARAGWAGRRAGRHAGRQTGRQAVAAPAVLAAPAPAAGPPPAELLRLAICITLRSLLLFDKDCEMPQPAKVSAILTRANVKKYFLHLHTFITIKGTTTFPTTAKSIWGSLAVLAEAMIKGAQPNKSNPAPFSPAQTLPSPISQIIACLLA